MYPRSTPHPRRRERAWKKLKISFSDSWAVDPGLALIEPSGGYCWTCEAITGLTSSPLSWVGRPIKRRSRLVVARKSTRRLTTTTTLARFMRVRGYRGFGVDKELWRLDCAAVQDSTQERRWSVYVRIGAEVVSWMKGNTSKAYKRIGEIFGKYLGRDVYWHGNWVRPALRLVGLDRGLELEIVDDNSGLI